MDVDTYIYRSTEARNGYRALWAALEGVSTRIAVAKRKVLFQQGEAGRGVFLMALPPNSYVSFTSYPVLMPSYRMSRRRSRSNPDGDMRICTEKCTSSEGWHEHGVKVPSG